MSLCRDVKIQTKLNKNQLMSGNCNNTEEKETKAFLRKSIDFLLAPSAT
jgi:hypothetical protein